MTDSTDRDDVQSDEGPRTSARGEAAWKAATEQVAERNKAARKGGKERREAYERGREDTRRAAERKRIAQLIESRPSRRPPGT